MGSSLTNGCACALGRAALGVRSGLVWLSLIGLMACSTASEPARPSDRSGAAGTSSSAALIPAHIRKLSNAEYDEAVQSLLGFEAHEGASFANDVRNGFFTRSMLQQVDDTRGDQLQRAAEVLAKRAVSERFEQLVPCRASTGTDCAKQFIARFAARAFRRPLDDEERTDLLGVFQTASTGGSFGDGVGAVIAAVLQSASFLYIPSLGTGDRSVRSLGAYEVASALSFFALGAPPDEALLAAAAKDELAQGEARVAHFTRLVRDNPAAKRQLRRFVREWLGIDRLDLVSPTSDLDYATLRPHLDAETDAFIDEVMFRGDASLSSLIAADFSMVDTTLAAHYELSGSRAQAGYVRTSLRAVRRRGILQQGAFLSVHAGGDHSSPVKRGAAILARLLCREIPLPSGAVAVSAMQPPPAAPDATTRERFAEHSLDPACHGCHAQLDPIGFGLENFDQVGRYRATEHDKPVDSSGVLSGTDVDGAFADGVELVELLSRSEVVQRCFARNLFRFAAAVSSSEAEDAFIGIWQQLPSASRDVLSVMSAYVGSELFVTRKVL